MSTPGNSLNIKNAGLVKFDGTATFSGVTTTQFDVLVGAASNGISNVGPGTAGQVLQSGGNAANPAYSTATYPAVATGTGTILRADGTNWVATTATYPTTTTAFELLVSTAANVIGEIAAGATGTVLIGNTGAVPSFSTAPVVTSISTGTVSGNPTLAISTTNQTITMNSGTGAISISTDASATTVDIATGGAVKTTTLGSTNSTSATTVQSGSGALNVTSTNGALTINSGTGALGISTDASATTISIGTGGAVKGLTLGSTNSTSATTVQSGSGALNITSTNGAITMNSGTGTVGIGTDATGATYNFATGAGAKVVTVGSTNGASSLALKTGTADFSLASATGNIIVALDTGEVTKPLQPAFLAYQASSQTNATGDGTVYTLGSTTDLTEIYDQSSDFDPTTGTFTAPVTGRYLFTLGIAASALTASFTALAIQGRASNRTANTSDLNIGAVRDSSNNAVFGNSFFMDMDAADTITAVIIISGSTKTATVLGDANLTTFFGGALIC